MRSKEKHQSRKKEGLNLAGKVNRIHTNREPQTKEKSGNEVAALPVVRPLVFEPLSVALHTANLLAVVVRHRV